MLVSQPISNGGVLHGSVFKPVLSLCNPVKIGGTSATVGAAGGFSQGSGYDPFTRCGVAGVFAIALSVILCIYSTSSVVGSVQFFPHRTTFAMRMLFTTLFDSC
ncbi:unnamed protein product [Adineta ricciae]|uniref:Uncharacterized protein n=1 Tax=Adineta ricciae TaxID=249248 RepID=A0A815ADX6_ADIRI|nr:unnamed protein product [Adineta ricciae]